MVPFKKKLKYCTECFRSKEKDRKFRENTSTEKCKLRAMLIAGQE
jgi:hypothetical protein